MQRRKIISLMILVLALALSACSAQPTQVQPTSAPTRIIDAGHGITSEELDPPLTEAEVPRISVEEARVALENGAAVIVDVRSPGAFEESRIAGAISVPLGMIERDLASVPLGKDQWIITYCT